MLSCRHDFSLRKDWVLLILLTLFWGSNWSVMKIGVRDFPPISFRMLSMLGGVAALWLAARMQGVSLAVPRGQAGTLVKLAIPNMVVWHLCIILGIKMLSSGRAAILGYTMPVWAVLCGLFFFRERVTRLAWIGVGCALAGALLLLSSEFATLAGQPLGSLLALIAAAGWGYGTVLLKRTPHRDADAGADLLAVADRHRHDQHLRRIVRACGVAPAERAGMGRDRLQRADRPRLFPGASGSGWRARCRRWLPACR